MALLEQKISKGYTGTYGKSANGKNVLIMESKSDYVTKPKAAKPAAKKPAAQPQKKVQPKSTTTAKSAAPVKTNKTAPVKNGKPAEPKKSAPTKTSSAAQLVPAKKVSSDKTTVKTEKPRTIVNGDGTKTMRGKVTVKRVQTSKENGVKTTITQTVTREDIITTPFKPANNKGKKAGKPASSRRKVTDI